MPAALSFLAALLLISDKVATKPQDITNHRFQIADFSKNAPELVVDCLFFNSSFDPRPLPPPMKIRGVQRPDGAFYPYVSLAVGQTEEGPWTEIPARIPRGKELQVIIPAWLSMQSLRVDLAPFFPKIRTMRWGKITLPSGDAITVQLKEIDRAWNNFPPT